MYLPDTQIPHDQSHWFVWVYSTLRWIDTRLHYISTCNSCKTLISGFHSRGRKCLVRQFHIKCKESQFIRGGMDESIPWPLWNKPCIIMHINLSSIPTLISAYVHCFQSIGACFNHESNVSPSRTCYILYIYSLHFSTNEIQHLHSQSKVTFTTLLVWVVILNVLHFHVKYLHF